MKPFFRVLITTLLISFFAIPAWAQKDLYEKLNSQIATHFKKREYATAIPVAKQALDVAEKTFGKNHPYVSASLNNLALLYMAQNNYKEAEPLYERSLKIVENVGGKKHPQIVPILENLIKCSEELGNVEKAYEYEDRLKDIR